jgi:hypothetical protein
VAKTDRVLTRRELISCRRMQTVRALGGKVEQLEDFVA